MKVTINFLPEFFRQAKQLRKRYASFERDYQLLLDDLEANPFLGVPLGNGVRKIRMAVTSKGKGKSGGARVLTYSVNKNTDDDVTVTLLSVYDKSKISNVTDEYIEYLVHCCPVKTRQNKHRLLNFNDLDSIFLVHDLN